MPQHVCGGQRPTCRGQFSPLTCELVGSSSGFQAWEKKTPLLADPSPWLCLLLFKPRKSCWLSYIHGALHKTLFVLTADPMWYTEHLAAGVEFSAVSLCFVHRRKCEFYLTAQAMVHSFFGSWDPPIWLWAHFWLFCFFFNLAFVWRSGMNLTYS